MPGIDYTLGMKASGFDAGIKGALGKLGELGATVAKVTAGAGLAAGAGVAALIAKSIGKAADMETLETAFAPLIGGAAKAKERIAELSAFAAATPFELPEVASASRVLQTLTKGALATGQGLTLVGDVASATNTPFSEIATTIGRLYDGLQSGRPVGEAASRLQELGVISGDARGQIEDLQKEGKKGPEVWGIAEKALKSFSGSMARQSVTWNGKMSTLSDTISQTMAAFGQPIMDSLKPYLDALTAKIESIKALAIAVGQKIASAFDTAMAAWQTGNMTELFGAGLSLAVINSINSFSSGIRQAMAYLSAAMQSIMDQFRESAGGQGVMALFSALGDFLGASITKAILTAMNKIPGLEGDFAPAIDEQNMAKRHAMLTMKKEADALIAGNVVAGAVNGAVRANDAGTAAAAKAGNDNLIDPSAALGAYAKVQTTLATQVAANKAAVAAAAKAMDAKLTQITPTTGEESPAAKAEKSTATRAPATDRLAQIGGYVGGASRALAQKAADATAKWTEKTASNLDKLLARPLSATAAAF